MLQMNSTCHEYQIKAENRPQLNLTLFWRAVRPITNSPIIMIFIKSPETDSTKVKNRVRVPTWTLTFWKGTRKFTNSISIRKAKVKRISYYKKSEHKNITICRFWGSCLKTHSFTRKNWTNTRNSPRKEWKSIKKPKSSVSKKWKDNMI